MTPLLEIQALQVAVMSDEGPRHILHRVDLSVEEGGALAIVGESGSGKSMTLRAVTRTLPARAHVSGHVLLAGANVLELDDRALAAARTETIGMIFQDPRAAINPVHTVGDFLCEALVRSGRAGKEEAAREAVRVLGDVGVTGPERRLRQYPHELSGGLLQRMMIASVILMRPRLVLADEPTTALDVTTQSDVMAILDEMRHEHGTALVLVTHDLELAAAVCDNTVVMYAGHVLEEQASEHLHADPLHPYTAALLASRPGAAGTGDLPVIPGRPKSASEVDQGCPFADRCRYVVDRCRSEPVSLWPAGSGRTACLRRDEILPLGQPGEESAQGEHGNV